MKNIFFLLFLIISLSSCQTNHNKSKHPFLARDIPTSLRPGFTPKNEDSAVNSYLGLKEKKMINWDADSSSIYQENFLKKGFRAMNYLDSYVVSLMKRPVSSALRLMTLTRDTTYDVITPDLFTLFDTSPIPPLSEGQGMDLKKWEKKLDKIVGHKSSYGQIKFLLNGDQFFPRLIESIQHTQKSILFRTFIFDNDDVAVKIADLLKKKSNTEDVDIKVLLDGIGVIMGEGSSPDALPPGFVPPESMPGYLAKDSSIEVRVRSNVWFKADHIKTTIIDNKICFTGGMNIGREYRYDWHDLMMEVTGPVVKAITKDFEGSWAHTSKLGDIAYLAYRVTDVRSFTKKEGYPIRLLYTRFNDPQIYRAQLSAIQEAKKYIYISNAYFSDNTILYALIRARRRGVDVRVILPVNGNHKIMNESNVVTANIMFKNGIRVFFYPGMSHIKAAIYDGWLCTGSANFDKLSLKDNLELDLATSHQETVQILEEKLFNQDFKKSKEMTKLLGSNLKKYFAEFLADHL